MPKSSERAADVPNALRALDTSPSMSMFAQKTRFFAITWRMLRHLGLPFDGQCLDDATSASYNMPR